MTGCSIYPQHSFGHFLFVHIDCIISSVSGILRTNYPKWRPKHFFSEIKYEFISQGKPPPNAATFVTLVIVTTFATVATGLPPLETREDHKDKKRKVMAASAITKAFS